MWRLIRRLWCRHTEVTGIEGLAWQCDHCGHVRRLSDYY
jgi:ribosomal protein L37AE/L43A